MNRRYDVFERFPDDTVLWRGQVTGLENLRSKLNEMAQATGNECFGMYLSTQEIVLRVNIKPSLPEPYRTAK